MFKRRSVNLEGRFWDTTGIRTQSSASCYINKELKESTAGALVKLVDNAQLGRWLKLLGHRGVKSLNILDDGLDQEDKIY